MKSRSFLVLLFLAANLIFSSIAWAQDTNKRYTQIEIIPQSNKVTPGQVLTFAINIEIHFTGIALIDGLLFSYPSRIARVVDHHSFESNVIYRRLYKSRKEVQTFANL